ncbi:hypothetical protein BDP27DRAFT_1428312 [Rhodocollybia butyracea]|uniref:Uncharacterized protein n=1 Tax=Rhodocollybia butyracea TaxID=206335 RepID=A0A9P5U0N3_9AGAR|nr:hypothetical protein BDP27DRAFT_1428312 [Rhodocollybia butyracea]
MPTITSLPIEITTKILRIYVSFYINPLFDITRVPIYDSSLLELQRLTRRKDLLAILTTCRLFAAVLPALIFRRVNIFSTRAVASFHRTVHSRSLITGHFAEALTYVEFSFSFSRAFPLGSVTTGNYMGEILQRAPNVRCVAFSFDPVCPLFISRLLTFVRNQLPSHVSAILLRMEITNHPLPPATVFNRVIWSDRTWPAFFASIPHVSEVTNAWLANASPALQRLQLHYGHHALRHLAFFTYVMNVQAGLIEPPDVLAHISCGYNCSEWMRCTTGFIRDRAVFPAAVSSPQYARLFIFGKSLPFC